MEKDIIEISECARCKKKVPKREMFLIPKSKKSDKEMWVCYSCWNMIA